MMKSWNDEMTALWEIEIKMRMIENNLLAHPKYVHFSMGTILLNQMIPKLIQLSIHQNREIRL